MTKKICISGYYGFNNFGDETILGILIDNLKKIISNAEITVFSSSPKSTASIYNVKSVQTFNLFSVIKTLIESDYLISGGGSLLQDTTSAKSLIYYLGVIFTAKLLNKKYIIFAQGIGPINNNIFAKFTAFILKHASLITVRDENSIKLLESWKVNSIKCYDPVWNITLPKKQKTGKIGIQLRNFNGINDYFIKKLADAINKYYANREINILSLQNSLDWEICNKLKTQIPNANIITNTSNEKIIEEICMLDELIAMRYHACLIGIKAGVKVLPIDYDIKVTTLANEFNLKCINIKQPDDIAKNIEEFAGNEIIYNKEKINNMYFDFKLVEDIIKK